MTPLDSGMLWRLATQRWAEIEAISPDLAPAVGLQRRLVRLLLNAAASLNGLPPLSLPSDTVSDRLRRGLPVLRNETIAIPRNLADFLPEICTALADAGAGDSALHIRSAITGDDIDAISLLNVSLARNHKALRTSALHLGFAPDLLWLIGELGSSPLANRLAMGTMGSDPRTGTGVRPQGGGWDRGYCPFCGSWPAFIESIGGDRLLRCSYCALGWSLDAHRCVYCRAEGDTLVTAALDTSRPQQRVELCGACSCYTKVLEAAAPTPFPLLAIDDLATMPLDAGAMERGYRRPELFDLDAIEPRTSTC